MPESILPLSLEILCKVIFLLTWSPEAKTIPAHHLHAEDVYMHCSLMFITHEFGVHILCQARPAKNPME